MLKVHYEDDHMWAEVDELPGCFASGKDMEELKEALAEAISMCLDLQTVARVDIEPIHPVKPVRARAELVP
jgi:predicted RNase H-like HicB family nuclease